MDIRISLTAVLFCLVLALCACSVIGQRSKKSIGKPAALLDLALIPPIIGNILIINSDIKAVSVVGYFFHFIGMNLVVLATIGFAMAYCKGARGKDHTHSTPKVVYIALVADTVQLLINPLTHHAFDVEPAMVSGKTYYVLIPHAGLTIHRILDYLILLCIILIFLIVTIKTPKVNKEKYLVVLISMVSLTLWETYYIFSRTPIDRSMIGFGVVGVLVFYFAVLYKPLYFLNKMLSSIAADLRQAIFVFDPDERCIWANEQGMKFTCTEETELESINEKLKAIFSDIDTIEDGEFSKTTGTGDNTRYYLLQKRTMTDSKGRLTGLMISIYDNTAEQQRLKREFYNSTHDSLTGLYTREYLYECIKTALSSDSKLHYLIIFVDVKNFKIVNDIFSNEFGDMALKQIAQYIVKNSTERCIYGRLAGDTFGILAPKGDFKKHIIERDVSGFTVTDGTVEHHLLIHLGVCEVTDRNTDVSVLFDRAHLAISAINDDYNTHIAYYDNNLREKVLQEQKITAGLKNAIAQMHLRPFLQPIADKDGKIVGAEALARWVHPEQGLLPPASFIPILEKNGQIVEVDKHMWRCACETLTRWDNDLFISVNISPKDFYFTDVVADIKALVSEYGIPPERLRIEITETVMMNSADERMANLAELREAGFIIEMDDFGSGYSSLNMLKEMPVDVLKIDMRFLSSTNDKERAKTIVKNIIRLSEELGIESLTEGVETQHQFEQLALMGCSLFQGYYFAKPMPTEEFESFAGIEKN